MVEIGNYRDKMLALEYDSKHKGPIVVHRSMIASYDDIPISDWNSKYISPYRINEMYYSTLGYAMKSIYALSENFEDIYIAPGYHKLSTWDIALEHILKLIEYKPNSNMYIHIGGRNKAGKDYLDKTARNLILGRPIFRGNSKVDVNEIVSSEILF